MVVGVVEPAVNVAVLAAPTRPSRRSSLRVVVMETVALVLLPVLVAGIPLPASNGALMFAPTTLKPIIEPPVMPVPA
jgi:hypothetical protein